MSIEIDDEKEYLKLDKISDDVYALAPNVVLKFNVSLSKISGGKRYHYHNEYEYNNSAINQPLITVKRTFDYYLSFESNKKMDNNQKLFIRIGPQEYFLFMMSLNVVESWFTDKKFSKLFVKDKGSLILTSPIPSHTISHLPMDKYIEFKPTIIDRGIANADKEPGVMINFNDECTIEFNLDKFMGLKYVISCFNMYQAAITLLNYNGRPPYGTNRIVMNGEHTVYPSTKYEITGSSGVVDRVITPKGTKNNISSLEG